MEKIQNEIKNLYLLDVINLNNLQPKDIAHPTEQSSAEEIVEFYFLSLYLGIQCFFNNDIDLGLKTIDTSIAIVGAIISDDHRSYEKRIFQIIQSKFDTPSTKDIPTEFYHSSISYNTVNPISEIKASDIPLYILQDEPYIVRGYANSWSATELFKSPSFWYDLTLKGNRYVPLEIGSQYTKADWTVSICPFRTLIENMIQEPDDGRSSQKIPYLAQYDLHTHFPSLKELLVDPVTNFWIGPAKTISPLHKDEKDNKFIQLVGRKKFILYPPRTRAYPLRNTSLIDLTQSQDPIYRKKFAKFPWEQGKECILNPGDLLGIPKKWWHFVCAIDSGVGINYWF